MSPGAALLHAAAAAWAVGHMFTAAMTLSSAAASSPAPGQAGTPGSRVISISVRAGAQAEEPRIIASEEQSASPAGTGCLQCHLVAALSAICPIAVSSVTCVIQFASDQILPQCRPVYVPSSVPSLILPVAAK